MWSLCKELDGYILYSIYMLIRTGSHWMLLSEGGKALPGMFSVFALCIGSLLFTPSVCQTLHFCRIQNVSKVPNHFSIQRLTVRLPFYFIFYISRCREDSHTSKTCLGVSNSSFDFTVHSNVCVHVYGLHLLQLLVFGCNSTIGDCLWLHFTT